MAAYTQSNYAGPPTGGRYDVGDTVTDMNGIIWRCNASGWPGQFSPQNRFVITASELADLPVPTASLRGTIRLLTHPASATDDVIVCIDADGVGTYAWAVLSSSSQVAALAITVSIFDSVAVTDVMQPIFVNPLLAAVFDDVSVTEDVVTAVI